MLPDHLRRLNSAMRKSAVAMVPHQRQLQSLALRSRAMDWTLLPSLGSVPPATNTQRIHLLDMQQRSTGKDCGLRLSASVAVDLLINNRNFRKVTGRFRTDDPPAYLGHGRVST